MKTYFFSESRLPTLAGPFCGVYFVWGQRGGRASMAGFGLGGGSPAASLCGPGSNRFVPFGEELP